MAGQRQAIIWTNAGTLLIRTLGTNFSEILSEIHSFSFSKMHLKMSSAKWRLFSPGLNELNLITHSQIDNPYYTYEYNNWQISNTCIRHTIIGTKLDHSDVIGASLIGSASTTSSFPILHLASMDWAQTTARREKNHLNFGIWCTLYYLY